LVERRKGLTDSLDLLKQAESEARLVVEDARRRAAATRAGISGEIESLRMEKSRRVAQEIARREAAVHAEVSKAGKALMLKAEEEVESLQRLEDGLSDKAFEILRKTLSGQAD
jgi:F0F1-type ATP synthase membrane subunit b/b'